MYIRTSLHDTSRLDVLCVHVILHTLVLTNRYFSRYCLSVVSKGQYCIFMCNVVFDAVSDAVLQLYLKLCTFQCFFGHKILYVYPFSFTFFLFYLSLVKSYVAISRKLGRK